ncbi:Ada metal-binding domain-containing protein [Marinoscillum sp.]|uniref:Ada metal-binding domain-containing protein n=1 Tax=Marinoscillum sp. TaxID=2024838 RepID=UPI003BA94B90
MVLHTEVTDVELRQEIRRGQLVLAGHRQSKTYGKLRCRSGQRMHRENRIFFESESEALVLGYRPCGSCMHAAFKKWKHGVI